MSERRPSRLNLEPELFVDPRYHALVDKVGRFAATGMIANFFLLAQGYYKQRRRVPKELFLMGGYGPLLEVGLAKEEEDGVRAAGEAEQFSWLRSKAEAGKRSGEARRNKREHTRTHANETEPPPPPPTPIYKEECAAPQAPHSADAGAPAVFFQCDLPKNRSSDTSDLSPPLLRAVPKPAPAWIRNELAAIYALYPRREGKKAGMKVLERTVRDPEALSRLRIAVESYVALCKRENRETKHMKHWGTFANNWEDYVTDELAVIETRTKTENWETNEAGVRIRLRDGEGRVLWELAEHGEGVAHA